MEFSSRVGDPCQGSRGTGCPAQGVIAHQAVNPIVTPEGGTVTADQYGLCPVCHAAQYREAFGKDPE